MKELIERLSSLEEARISKAVADSGMREARRAAENLRRPKDRRDAIKLLPDAFKGPAARKWLSSAAGKTGRAIKSPKGRLADDLFSVVDAYLRRWSLNSSWDPKSREYDEIWKEKSLLSSLAEIAKNPGKTDEVSVDTAAVKDALREIDEITWQVERHGWSKKLSTQAIKAAKKIEQQFK